MEEVGKMFLKKMSETYHMSLSHVLTTSNHALENLGERCKN
jgi:hypothetical protein